MIKLDWDPRTINVFAKFENVRRKIAELDANTVFQCTKLEEAQKKSPNLFCSDDKTQKLC